MGHDQRFKEFLHAFFQEFLKLFYPQVEERLDFESLEFLDTEVFTKRGDGSRREADVVAKLTTADGAPEIVLVHVEVQARPEPDVGARMFEYYSLLRARHEIPVFPIVVYLTRGREGFAHEEYRSTLFGFDILRFRYESVRLARLNAEEYLEKGGPVGAALASLMNRSATTASVEELRVSMLWKVIVSALDDAKQFILVDLIETYFQLTDAENARYQELVARKEHRKVQDVELSWSEKLIAEGRREGHESGILEGKRSMLLRQLERKFGMLPDTVVSHIAELDDAGVEGLIDRVLAAASLDDMGF